MAYIAIPLNHFRSVQAWAKTNDARANLDMTTFVLEMKLRNRVFQLLPQFAARTGTRMGNVHELIPNAVGFIGWLPYRPVGWEHGVDKVRFKQLLAKLGLPAPALTKERTPHHDYLCKWSKGSFGYEIHGPFRSGTSIPETIAPSKKKNAGELFAEEFVHGENIKVWFWGGTPFFAHRHTYPEITGDGVSTVTELVRRRCTLAGVDPDNAEEMASVRQFLSYQGLTRATVPAKGVKFSPDYRYDRRFEPIVVTASSDSSLAQFPPPLMQQLEAAGIAVAQEMRKDIPAPVLFAMDGVLPADGKIRWLEMNCNPVLPPDGYPLVFRTLFGEGPSSRASATASENSANVH